MMRTQKNIVSLKGDYLKPFERINVIVENTESLDIYKLSFQVNFFISCMCQNANQVIKYERKYIRK